MAPLPPPPLATAPDAAPANNTNGNETDTSLSSSLPPSPSSAFDAWATLRGRYRIPPEEVRELLSDSGPFPGDADALLLALLPAAALLARPPISRYHVGAAGLAASGAIYLGGNMELPRCPLNQSVHAEQFVVCNLAAHAETRLLTLAISAAPCGHCRQFYCELHRADAVRFVFGAAADGGGGSGGSGAGDGNGGAAAAAAVAAAAGAAAPLPPPAPRCFSLDELLPARFGPLDLLVPHDPVIEAAQRAAARYERRRSSSAGGERHRHHHAHPPPHHHHRRPSGEAADAAAVAAAEGMAPPPTAKAFPPLMLEPQDNRVALAPWVLLGGGAGLPLRPTSYLSADDRSTLAARAADDATFREALERAARAARHGSYAPYTRAPSGVAFVLKAQTAAAEEAGASAAPAAPAAPPPPPLVSGGRVGYLEAAAYNPGLPPLQAALAAGLALGELRGLQDVAEVVVAELDDEDEEAGGGAGAGAAGAGAGAAALPGATAGLVKHGFVIEAAVRAALGSGVRVWRVPLVRI
jgi:homodimeric cytidine deaminase